MAEKKIHLKTLMFLINNPKTIGWELATTSLDPAVTESGLVAMSRSGGRVCVWTFECRSQSDRGAPASSKSSHVVSNSRFTSL